MKNSYFPIFFDLSGKKILFVGGGRIATRRILAMLSFDCEITVVAPAISEKLEQVIKAGEPIAWINRAFFDEDLKGCDIVCGCTDREALNHNIYQSCKDMGILVNNCSNKEECDFYFPAIVKNEDTVVAVNCGGRDHKKTKEVKEKIQKLL